MALIGRIRKNSWLLILLIGLGLAAFIAMDIITNSSKYGGGNDIALGKVNGEKISYREFNDFEDAVYAGNGSDPYVRRNFIWNYFVNSKMIGSEAKANGLTVSRDELMDLQFGERLSPLIQQRFTSNQGGQVDRSQLENIRLQIENNQLDPKVRRFWAYQEKEIINDQLQNKMGSIIDKAYFTPSWMVDQLHKDNSVRSDIAYVRVPYSVIGDADASVSDSEISSYISKHSQKYSRKEETRGANYLAFDVAPTSKDSASVRASFAGLMDEFRAASNDTLFLQTNDGIFGDTYLKSNQLPAFISDADIMSDPVGTVYGPFESPGSIECYKKLGSTVTIPDSVKSRHILFNAKTQQDYAFAYQKADSLVKVLEAGTTPFDSLARQYSQGPTSVKGGELGYAAINQMVKPFNDFIFYSGEVGKPGIVLSQFGVHVVEVQDRKYKTRDKGVKIGTLRNAFVPSEETQDSIYDVVLNMLSDNRDITTLRQSIEDRPELRVQSTDGMAANDFYFANFGSGSTSRDIIKFLYEPSTAVGELAPTVYTYQDPINYYNNRYVIVGLKDIKPKGLPSVEDIRLEVESMLMNKKKAKLLKDQIGDQTEFSQLVNRYMVRIDTARGIAFVNDNVQNLGEEPAIIASVSNMEKGSSSPLVEGKDGLYVYQVINKMEPSLTPNVARIKNSSNQQRKQNTKGGLLAALKRIFKVEDDRSKHF